MPLNVSQASFTSGELAPSLHARVDLGKYASGLKTCKNFFVHAHGGVSNRAGFDFIAEVKDSAKATRLIPFHFGGADTYALEFGNQYIRVIRNGAQVIDPVLPYEITTPYLEAELDSLRFVQSADIITLVHRNHAPRELSRTGHAAWSLNIINFVPQIDPPTGESVPTQTVGSGSIDRSYKITAVADETEEESLPSGIATTTTAPDNNWVAGEYIDVAWNAVAGASKYNVYKNKNGIYGYIGSTEDLTFRDDKISPTLDDTPPKARDPFPSAGDYPSAVTYYEQRLVFASTDNGPQTIWFSQTGNFHNFSTSSPSKADDAITVTIDANQVNTVESMIPLEDLIVLTSGAEHKITSGDNAFSFDNIRLKPQGFRGSASVDPIVIGATILYLQSKGSIVRDLAYALESDRYSGSDLSVMSEHLFSGHNITEWCYSQDPHSIIWGIRDDGILLGMTYMREHEVWAWHQHETDGAFESILSLPEAGDDALYVIVKRDIDGVQKRFIERLHTRTVNAVEDAFFVDSGLSYDGVPTSTLSGLSHLEGKEVTILADGNVHPKKTVSSGAITLDYAVSKAHVGLGYVSELETLEPPIPETIAKRKSIGRLNLRVIDSRGLWAGPDVDNMVELKQRTNEAWGEAIQLYSGDFEVVISPTWQNRGSVVIQQRDPLPLNIIAIMPSVAVGG